MPDITWDGRDLVMDVTVHPTNGHFPVAQRINISEHIREIVREELSRGPSPVMTTRANIMPTEAEVAKARERVDLMLTEADLPQFHHGSKDIDA